MWGECVGYVLYVDRAGYAAALERHEEHALAEDERLRSVAAGSARRHGGWYSHGAGDSVVLVLESRETARACWEDILFSLPGLPLRGGLACGRVEQDECGRACGRVVSNAASLVEDADRPGYGVLLEWGA